LVVLAGGGVLYLASPPHGLWWLAPVSLAVLALAVCGRSVRVGFGCGFLFGVAYLLPLLRWLYEFLGPDFGAWPWLGLVVLESLFFGLAGAGMAWVSRLPGAAVWMAVMFVAAEVLRSRVPFGGFPWGRVAFTQAGGLFLPLASVGGAVLVGFAVTLTGCALAVLAVRVRRGSRRWIRPAVVAALPVVAGLVLLPALDAASEDGTVTVAVVQGNAPDIGVRLREEDGVIRANHLAQARRLVADVRAGRVPRPDVVIFPESSNQFDPARRNPELDRLAGDLGVPVLAGGVAFDADGRVSNRMIWWDPVWGPMDEYAKQRLVPFGEFVPLRGIAEAVTPFTGDPGSEMVPGDRPGVFDIGAARLGLAICYEVAYDEVLTEATRAGANLLVVPTNNAWFGRTEMTYQQLAMARVRAVEHGRAVVVASTSGVSAIVRPDGTVARTTGQFTAETLVETVPLRSSGTLATAAGAVPESVLVGLAVIALAAAWWWGSGGQSPRVRSKANCRSRTVRDG
jgi:apolipoprotein N-acyltransferase